MEARSDRRLAAILAADVAGYSRLIGEDEEGTIAALRAVRADVVEPVIARFGGRIANTAGDSFVIEFRSAVDATRAALEIQAAMAGPEPGPIRLRIGLNVGDVVTNGDDILGDGVNVAARLEALANPGGIVASHAVVSYARSNIQAGFVPMGPQRVKNIAEPVEAYRILADGETESTQTLRRKAPRGLVLAAVGVVLLAVAAFWFKPWADNQSQAVLANMAFPLPDRPSIAVLPFSHDAATDATLSGGVTEDLITDLSRISELFVISGNTSQAYRDREITVARFAEELGVRFVVGGSLRRAGDALRINIRLTDTSTGELVWAERYDSGMDALFETQNQFALAIADALDLSLKEAERVEIETPETQELAAREAFQRGWELYARFNERDNYAAIPHFRAAVELDPEYGRAWAALALAHLRPHIFHHWSASTGDQTELHIAQFYEAMARANEFQTSLKHVVLALVNLTRPDTVSIKDTSRGTNEARREAAKAIALQPSDPEAHVTMGWALVAAGEAEEALSFIEAAMRLDPKHPSHYVLFQAWAYFALGKIEQAKSVILNELERNPKAKELMPMAASLLALTGDRRAGRGMVDQWQSGENARAFQENVNKYYFVVGWFGEFQHLNQRLKDGLLLAALPSGTSVTSLRADLTNGDAGAQRTAATALALFGADAAPAVPELAAALSSSSTFVRKEAAIALGKIGAAAAPALPALEAASGNGLAGRFAVRAIEEIRAAAGE